MDIQEILPTSSDKANSPLLARCGQGATCDEGWPPQHAALLAQSAVSAAARNNELVAAHTRAKELADIEWIVSLYPYPITMQADVAVGGER